MEKINIDDYGHFLYFEESYIGVFVLHEYSINHSDDKISGIKMVFRSLLRDNIDNDIKDEEIIDDIAPMRDVSFITMKFNNEKDFRKLSQNLYKSMEDIINKISV